MNDRTKTTTSGIAVIIGCFSMVIWIVYLAITGQVASGPWYGYLSAVGFFVMGVYFIFEVKKPVDKWETKHIRWIKSFNVLELQELFELQQDIQKAIDKKLEAMHEPERKTHK